MPLPQNSQLLVSHLQALPELDGRFSNITLVNYNSVLNQKQGCFSLVFKAFDKLEGKPVALKFYDPDPRWANDPYRVACFTRESDILRSLVTVERCLQLVKPLTKYNFAVPIAGTGGAVTLACQYFAIEWLEDRVEHYFLEQDKHAALDKLILFNRIVLAVSALHRKEIFHRDLKADNLRSFSLKGRQRVIAIDLGTAAKFLSGPLPSASYPSGSVGAPFYAGPEALAGLASNRLVARYCDIYALGCLLYELFHYDYFFYAVRRVNPTYDVRLSALASPLPVGGTDAARAAEWERGLAVFGRGVMPVPMTATGNSVPAGIATILENLLAELTHLDYRKRPSLEFLHSRIRTAIKVLGNDRLYRLKLEQRRNRRRLRLAKLEAKKQRLLARHVPTGKP